MLAQKERLNTDRCFVGSTVPRLGGSAFAEPPVACFEWEAKRASTFNGDAYTRVKADDTIPLMLARGIDEHEIGGNAPPSYNKPLVELKYYGASLFREDPSPSERSINMKKQA